jgi:hypothetical protein
MHNPKNREALAHCDDSSVTDRDGGTPSRPTPGRARQFSRRLRKLVADPNYPGIKELRGVAEKLLDRFRVK